METPERDLMALPTQSPLLPGTPEAPIERPRGVERAKRIQIVYRVYGRGPDGAKCKTCRHLFYQGHARQFPKCGVWGATKGTATDWSTRYDACGKYEERKGQGDDE